jgi:hypothetical protein
MNFYYEIADSVVDEVGGKYFASYNFHDGFRYNKYMMRANRVWGEHDSGRVYFIKNRYKDCTNTPVDMEEFIFIKLRSKPL